MDNVTQKDPYGCSVACVASVLKINYKNSKKLFSKKDNATTLGFWCKDVIAALKNANKLYAFKYIKPKVRKLLYQPNIIVFIARSKKYPAGHYLARTENNTWMDPWINWPSELEQAKSGFRKRLPGKPIYIIYPTY